MQTSRTQGILVYKMKHGYEMANAGEVIKRETVVCHEFGGDDDGIAFDLEQIIMQAIFDMSERSSAQDAKQDDSLQDFFDNDSPTDEEVAEMALSIEMALKASKSVKLSAFMQQFTKIVDSGLIKTDTGEPIHTSAIWRSIKRDDKLKIATAYCAFFANPLAQQ